MPAEKGGKELGVRRRGKQSAGGGGGPLSAATDKQGNRTLLGCVSTQMQTRVPKGGNRPSFPNVLVFKWHPLKG